MAALTNKNQIYIIIYKHDKHFNIHKSLQNKFITLSSHASRNHKLYNFSCTNIHDIGEKINTCHLHVHMWY